MLDAREDDGRCRPRGMMGVEEEIMIQSMRSISVFWVKLYLNGLGIEATVNTAADVAIIADHMLRKS